MNYDAIIEQIVEEAIERYHNGEGVRFEIGLIPDIEYMDVDSIRKGLRELFIEAVGDWELIDPIDGF